MYSYILISKSITVLMSWNKNQGHLRIHLLLKMFFLHWCSIDQEMDTVLNIYLTALKEFCMTFINPINTNIIFLKHKMGSWLFNILNRNTLTLGSFFYQSQHLISSKSITRICKFFRTLLITVLNLSKQFFKAHPCERLFHLNSNL